MTATCANIGGGTDSAGLCAPPADCALPGGGGISPDSGIREENVYN